MLIGMLILAGIVIAGVSSPVQGKGCRRFINWDILLGTQKA